MEILKQHTTLLHYTIDPFYFQKYSETSKSQYTSSYWKVGAKNTYVLQYNIFFSAKSAFSQEYFINYHNRLELRCRIENIEVDAREVIHIKEIVNISTQLFLMENTQDYFNLLNFRPITFAETESSNQEYATRDDVIKKEIINLKRVMGTLAYEEMSEEEKNLPIK